MSGVDEVVVQSSPEQIREGEPINQILALNDADLGLGKSPQETSGNDLSAAIESASFLVSVPDVPDGTFGPFNNPLLSALDIQHTVIVKGSPGHTPFPDLESSNRFDFLNVVPFNESMPPPPVPCNSPDDAELMEALKTEAKRQETEIKAKMEGKNLIEMFKTPSPQLPATSAASKSRKRRNRKDLCSGMTVADLEKLSNDKKITEYHSPMSINEKEVRRRNRISSCVCMLRKIVPGITEDTENTEVFETSAKYILYLKQKVGSEHDVQFLSELMPL